MDNKVLIISDKKTNIIESIMYKFDQERIEYDYSSNINYLLDNNEFSTVIIIGNSELSAVLQYADVKDISIICVNNKKPVIDSSECVVNYIITDLCDDENIYTGTQKEFLFRKDIYSVLNDKIYELIKTPEEYINGLAIDATGCKSRYKDWIFEFDSISESYRWLLKKNKLQNKNIEDKAVNFMLDRLYNDSDKEIKYLIDKLDLIKNGKKSSDIFICNKEDIEDMKKNHFIGMLIKNTSDSYKFYVVDKDKFQNDYPEEYKKMHAGILVYDDCVYIDYLNNEYSLGYVDCKQESVDEYNKLYDFVVEKLGQNIKTEADLYEL